MVENPAFLTQQIITYIGNKRSLLSSIGQAADQVRHELGGKKLRVLDAFSGSGVVSRLLKSKAAIVYANDIEDYARVMSECFLHNSSDLPWREIHAALDALESCEGDLDHFNPGFIERLYAPVDEDHITPQDRVFYSKKNARRLDVFRQALNQFEPEVRTALLGPLLSEASIHANTAGVFKGFYKDRKSGIGRFGGSGADALFRILGPITPRIPVLSNFRSDFTVFQEDANDLVDLVSDLDLAYIDPPYNQHPYGSNYFMLNLIVNYQEPTAISKVSGIPTDWRRSDYNVRSQAFSRMAQLVEGLDSKYILISFNDEGFISPEEMRYILTHLGTFTEYATAYNTYRGSRNLASRSIHVTEHLYLLKKG